MARFQTRVTQTQKPSVRRSAENDSESASQREANLHPVLRLQQQVGNAQIARMLAQRAASPEEEEMLQTKRESSVAQRVGSAEEEEMLQTKRTADIAQRASSIEEEEMLQTKRTSSLAQRDDGVSDDDGVHAGVEVGMAGGPISDGLASAIQSKRGGGSPLDSSTQSQMETAFGTDFGDVHLHTDSKADALNRSLSAEAFTTGNDIFFSDGAYQPTSSEGRSLIAHELTHVVQQRSMNTSGPMTVGAADDTFERQADSVASSVVSPNGVSAQRQIEEDGAQRSIARQIEAGLDPEMT